MDDRPGAGAPPYDELTPSPRPAAADAPEAERFPWPPARNEPALQALAETWRRSVFEPSRFYRALSPQAPLGPALLYGVLVGVVASGIGLFWAALFTVAGLADGPLAGMTGAGGDWTWNIVWFLLAPAWAIAALFIAAAMVHVALVIFGGARNGFGATLRVLAYAGGPQLLVIVPVIGVYAGAVWGVVLAVIGLREVHGTSTGRAAAAVLAPPLLLIGLFMIVFIFALVTLTL